MGRELVWPFFCFLPFIFPVIMSALQYLMTAHLFRQFQVASLLGEGNAVAAGGLCFFFFSFSFYVSLSSGDIKQQVSHMPPTVKCTVIRWRNAMRRWRVLA